MNKIEPSSSDQNHSADQEINQEDPLTNAANSNVDNGDPWPYIAEFFKFKGSHANDSLLYECMQCHRVISSSRKSRNNLKKHLKCKHGETLDDFDTCIAEGSKARKGMKRGPRDGSSKQKKSAMEEGDDDDQGQSSSFMDVTHFLHQQELTYDSQEVESPSYNLRKTTKSNSQFMLRHNNHVSLVLTHLAEDETFMDVTLTAEGTPVKAHKSVLSAVSPYFSSVLKANPCQHPIIIMPTEVKYKQLVDIISFIYKGEASVTVHELKSFMRTAELLDITGLASPTDSDCKTTDDKTSELSTSNNTSGLQNDRDLKKNKITHSPIIRLTKVSLPRQDKSDLSARSSNRPTNLPSNLFKRRKLSGPKIYPASSVTSDPDMSFVSICRESDNTSIPSTSTPCGDTRSPTKLHEKTKLFNTTDSPASSSEVNHTSDIEFTEEFFESAPTEYATDQRLLHPQNHMPHHEHLYTGSNPERHHGVWTHQTQQQTDYTREEPPNH